ncbi:hypothetical protein NDU88_001390 [Pleurodeles waltl]|uniref:Uncharacterized protein n=1 Tax=Pleurodeles waltl TaxID=8319 RepID=A0AAV7THM8_PLEWA|nr:hypothetical protein NDU88_001390 [Pleurodeles waltl]
MGKSPKALCWHWGTWQKEAPVTSVPHCKKHRRLIFEQCRLREGCTPATAAPVTGAAEISLLRRWREPEVATRRQRSDAIHLRAQTPTRQPQGGDDINSSQAPEEEHLVTVQRKLRAIRYNYKTSFR